MLSHYILHTLPSQGRLGIRTGILTLICLIIWLAGIKNTYYDQCILPYLFMEFQRGKFMKNKKDSYMGDVGIIRKIDDIPELKDELIAAFDAKCHDHKAISCYSLLLAQHILDLTGTEPDASINECLEVIRKWQEGKAKLQDARNVAFRLHTLAREEKDPIRVKVYRVMGQVAATPHVKRHALIASDYAITLINLMHPKDMDEVRKERELQISLMRSI